MQPTPKTSPVPVPTMAEKFRAQGTRKLSRSASSLEKGSIHFGAFSARAGHHTIQGRRESQEDAHSIKLMNDIILDNTVQKGYGFVSVFDGHGGVMAADYCAQHFGPILAERLQQAPGDYETAVRRTLEKLEEQFLEMARKQELLDGTTACVVVINERGELVHGNVGDSEAVLARKDGGEVKALGLSEVHNPAKNDAEVERIKSVGGKMFGKRLCHAVLAPQFCSIAVSRSIGDLLFKDKVYTRRDSTALVAEPYICSRKLAAGDLFCIVACDGIWDSLSHEDAVKIVHESLNASNGDPDVASEALVETAYAKGSTDNCTAIVLVLSDSYSGSGDA